MSILQAIIIAIVEGLTEFLPVSSTGHMILTSSLMKIHEDEFVKTFEIAIQIGAILSVLTLYYKRFLVSIDIYLKLAVAFLPTGIIGFLAYKTIKTYLFNPITVSVMLIVGGVVLILLDKWSEKKASVYADLDKVSYKDAFKIGLIQCFSMIPGVSRSAATIFGGIASGFNRKQAAEFSFLLAIPTMFAATGYDLLKSSVVMTKNEWMLLGIGLIVAFISAVIAVKAFVHLLTRYGFKYFGYYRIILGILFLILAYQLDIKLVP
jgi:undecaprenyl-diphosphatase